MPVARRSSSRQACWHDVVADSHVSTAELTARFGPAVTALVQAVTDHACLGSYRQRKLVLREQVHGAGADAALLFAANKIAPRHRAPAGVRALDHDHPLHARNMKALGLPVRVGVPSEERDLMLLYPLPRGREPAVEYVPRSPATPRLSGRRVGGRGKRRSPSSKSGGQADTELVTRRMTSRNRSLGSAGTTGSPAHGAPSSGSRAAISKTNGNGQSAATVIESVFSPWPSTRSWHLSRRSLGPNPVPGH